MNILKRLYKFAESYRFSAYLLVSAVVFYLFLTIWSIRVPSSWIVNIADLWAFRLLYILLFLNMILCSIKRFGPIGRKLKSESGHEKLKPLGSVLFHLSLILVPIGIFAGMPGRFEGQFVLAEGQPFSGAAGDYVEKTPRDAGEDRLPPINMELNDIGAKFWSGGFLFERLVARCQVNNGSETWTANVELNSPFHTGGATINLTGYGWSPVYMLESPKGVTEGAVNLKVFPSGVMDSFILPDTPYQAMIKVWSDYKEVDGRPSSASFELKNPKIELAVYRGKLEVYRGLLALGEKAVFEGLKLSFTDVRGQGQFRVVRDRGLPLIWLGYTLALAGLAVRFL